MTRSTISNTMAAFSLLRAAAALVTLTDSGHNVDSERVQQYLGKVSAKTSRPIGDLLDLTVRELISLGYAVERSTSSPIPALPEPGTVIPGCSDKGGRRKWRRGKGSDNGQTSCL